MAVVEAGVKTRDPKQEAYRTKLQALVAAPTADRFLAVEVMTELMGP